MNVSLSPSVAPVAAQTSFKGSAGFAPISNPDIKETLNKFKESELGKTLIDKAKGYVKKVVDILKEEGGVKKLIDMAKQKFNEMGGMDTIKKGIQFVKDTYNKIVQNPTFKKIGQAIADAIKNTKPAA